MIRYLKVHKDILAVMVPKPAKKQLAETFVRFQEHYESPNQDFRGQRFTKKDYLDWYIKTYETDYRYDWDGFNIPRKAISSFVDSTSYVTGDHDLDKYELALYENSLDSKYIIGFLEGDLNTFHHELAHAFYYLDEDYRTKVNRIVIEHFKGLKTVMQALREDGYAEDFLIDEVQAYAVAGFGSYEDLDKGIFFSNEFEAAIQDVFYNLLENRA